MNLNTSILAGIVALLGMCESSGAIIQLNFSGTYDTRGGTVFGQNGAAVPYSYNLIYDTGLDTDLNYIPVGQKLGGVYTTVHEWHGYSRSGIVGSDLTFGDATWTSANLHPRAVDQWIYSDIWFDTDLETAGPTRAWMFFDLGGKVLEIGGGMSDATTVYLMANRSSVEQGSGFSTNMKISSVPETGASFMILLWTACVTLVRRR